MLTADYGHLKPHHQDKMNDKITIKSSIRNGQGALNERMEGHISQPFNSEM